MTWPAVPLGTLAAFAMGQAPPGAETNTDGIGTPFYRSGEFGHLTPTTRIWTTEPLRVGRRDDVFICVVGANSGEVNLGADGAIGRSVAAISPDDRLAQRYLFHFLTSITGRLRKGAQGSAQGVITKRALAEISVPLPPLNEQHRIVDLLEDHLSRLDAAEAYLNAAQQRDAVLHDQLLARELDAVPSDDAVLGDFLAVGLANGKSVPTSKGGFPVLRLTSLREGRIDLAERKDGAWTASDAARFLVQRGDFLISRGNGSLRLVGRGGLVVEDPDPVAFPDTLIRARPQTALLSPEFLSLVWNSPSVRRQIEKSARTTAGIYKVNQKDLAAIRLTVPTLTDQERVVSAVGESRTALARLADDVAHARTRSQSLRRSLLTAAFSGGLGV